MERINRLWKPSRTRKSAKSDADTSTDTSTDTTSSTWDTALTYEDDALSSTTERSAATARRNRTRKRAETDQADRNGQNGPAMLVKKLSLESLSTDSISIKVRGAGACPAVWLLCVKEVVKVSVKEKRDVKGYKDGSRYVGELNEARQHHGYGELFYQDGTVYRGTWHEGKYCGKGKLELVNGDVYDGTWKDHKRHGHGRYTFFAVRALWRC